MIALAQRPETTLESGLFDPELEDAVMDEPVAAPLILVIRRHSRQAEPEVKIYSFTCTAPETRCHLSLGARPENSPRRPPNGHLAIFTVNNQIQLTITGAQFMHYNQIGKKHVGFLLQTVGYFFSQIPN